MPRPTVELQRIYQQEWYKKRKEDRVTLALNRLGGKCALCDITTDLEFDHINPKTKEFSIRIGTTRSLHIFLEEVDKCQLLCKEHHEEKTRIDNGWMKVGSLEGRVHGALSTYKNGCRCVECKRANSDRRYHERKGIPFIYS